MSTSTNNENGRHGVLNPDDAVRPFYQKNALLTSSTTALDTLESQTIDKENRYTLAASRKEKVVGEEKVRESAIQAFTNIIVAMTDFSILKNKQMLIICIGNIFSMLGYYLPIMCLIPFAAEDLKVDREKAAFLMTVFGKVFI